MEGTSKSIMTKILQNNTTDQNLTEEKQGKYLIIELTQTQNKERLKYHQRRKKYI